MGLSGDGRRRLIWVLIWVALALLWWRELRKPQPDTVPPAPPHSPVLTTTAPASPVPVDAAPEPDAAPVPTLEDLAALADKLYVIAISTDSTRALLHSSHGANERLRVVVIDTGEVEGDITITDRSLDAVNRARTLLRPFPLGAGVDIAVSPDGKHGAFNDDDVDPVRVIWDDALGPVIFKPAGYHPIFSPDSTQLLFSGYDHHDRNADSAVYALYAVPVRGKHPARIKGTDGYDGEWAADSTTLAILTFTAAAGYCAHLVPFAPPLHVATRRCLADANVREVAVALSEHGTHVAWITGSDETARRHLRVMELATGAIVTDIDPIPATSILLTVSDGGRVLLDGALYEPGAHAARPIAGEPGSCVFRNETELVCTAGATGESITRVAL